MKKINPKAVEVSEGPSAAASAGLDQAAMQKIEELGDYLRSRGFLFSAEIAASEDMRETVMKIRGDGDRASLMEPENKSLALVVYYNFDETGLNPASNTAKSMMHQMALLRLQIAAANSEAAVSFEEHMQQHGEEHMREHHPQEYAAWLMRRANAAKNVSQGTGREMTEEELRNLPVTERFKN